MNEIERATMAFLSGRMALDAVIALCAVADDPLALAVLRFARARRWRARALRRLELYFEQGIPEARNRLCSKCGGALAVRLPDLAGEGPAFLWNLRCRRCGTSFSAHEGKLDIRPLDTNGCRMLAIAVARQAARDGDAEWIAGGCGWVGVALEVGARTRALLARWPEKAGRGERL